MTYRPGRPPIISPTSKTHLIRKDRNQEINTIQLKGFVSAPVSVERVRHYQRSDWSLSPRRIKLHVNIFWFDEKRFSLDGPDKTARYWHDKEREPRTLPKRHSGGGPIMICAGFSNLVKAELVFKGEQMTGNRYFHVLEEFCFLLHKPIIALRFMTGA